jgi:tetratricopeptide (TPR) repeat protein
MPRERSSSVYGYLSERVAPLNQGRRQMRATPALAVALLLSIVTASVAVGEQQRHPGDAATCPASSNAESTLGQASALLQQSQYAAAVSALRPDAHRFCDSRFSLLLAAALEGTGDIQGAQNTLQTAHARWPEDDRIATSLAREYLREGQQARAAEALAHFHATAATPLQEMELATVVYLAAHQLVAAGTLSRLAYATYPSARSLLLMANTLQMQGRYKDVITLLDAERATYGNSAPFLVTVAESEYDGKMFGPAQADLERAVVLQPGLYQAHYVLGNVLMSQGEYDQAAAEYRLAIGLTPDQPHAYYQLALALRTRQDSADEEGALQKALALDSHFSEAHSELGRLLLDENRVPEAVAQLNLAVTDNPHSEQAYTLLARGYARMGDIDKAKQTAARLEAVRSANHTGGTGMGGGAAQ